MEIRLLKANEIDIRVQSAKKTSTGVGCILLLYKNARVDMQILDEVFGTLGWEREHQLINNNLFCTIRVWDSDKKMWISKQDVGTESNTEKEKGQASDSFKRACFNLGIGRELYTSPFIWIDLKEGEYSENNGKVNVNAFTKFKVSSISYNNQREINELRIVDSKNTIRFNLGPEVNLQTEKPKQQGKKKNDKDDFKPACAECKKEISIAEHDYSAKMYQKPLCRACQNKAKKVG